jgi:starvation-inducible outer membrane lipoprotein
MKNRTKAFIIVAAMAGLLTGCASAPDKQAKSCPLGMKSGKDSCGAKGGCAGKNGCGASDNNGTKGS